MNAHIKHEDKFSVLAFFLENAEGLNGTFVAAMTDIARATVAGALIELEREGLIVCAHPDSRSDDPVEDDYQPTRQAIETAENLKVAGTIEIMVEPVGRTLRNLERLGILPLDERGAKGIMAGMAAIDEMFPGHPVDEDELANMIASAMGHLDD